MEEKPKMSIEKIKAALLNDFNFHTTRVDKTEVPPRPEKEGSQDKQESLVKAGANFAFKDNKGNGKKENKRSTKFHWFLSSVELT